MFSILSKHEVTQTSLFWIEKNSISQWFKPSHLRIAIKKKYFHGFRSKSQEIPEIIRVLEMHVSVTSKVQRTENMGSVHYVSDWEHGHCTLYSTVHYVSDWEHGLCTLCVRLTTWSMCTMCLSENMVSVHYVSDGAADLLHPPVIELNRESAGGNKDVPPPPFVPHANQ